MKKTIFMTLGIALAMAFNSCSKDDSTAGSGDYTYKVRVNSVGNYKLQGLPPGSYTLTVTPILPMTPATQTNVVVQAGQNTAVSTVSF